MGKLVYFMHSFPYSLLSNDGEDTELISISVLFLIINISFFVLTILLSTINMSTYIRYNVAT